VIKGSDSSLSNSGKRLLGGEEASGEVEKKDIGWSVVLNGLVLGKFENLRRRSREKVSCSESKLTGDKQTPGVKKRGEI